MKTKLEVLSLNDIDVISTSGEKVLSGMSDKSYQAYAYYQQFSICGIILTGGLGSVMGGTINYYDENDNPQSVTISLPAAKGNFNTGYWFHYDTTNNNKWQICTDESHHSSN